jgi:DsbC/DsbD-like thiol-disulfide interchange protein/cytochrome c biogenesis protein CcdA
MRPVARTILQRARAAVAMALALLVGAVMAAALSPAWASAPVSPPAITATAQSANVTITLLSSQTVVAPGSIVTLALRQDIAKGWHTYWRNPGDTGEATRIGWTLPEGASAGPIQWPAPKALPFGPLVNYGFEDQVILPVEITLPASLPQGRDVTLAARVDWLECADVCIPAGGDVAIRLRVASAAEPGPDADVIRAAQAALPKVLDAPARLTDQGPAGVLLSVSGPELAPLLLGARGVAFFPYEIADGALIDHAVPAGVGIGPDWVVVSSVKSASVPEQLTGPVEGVLRLTGGGPDRVVVVRAELGPPLPGVGQPRVASPTGQASLSVPLAIGFALLGGLILNLMPCVFPILSMKALSLARAAHGQAREARAHGWAYGAGVLGTFLALAGVLIGLQAAGHSVGWGFQLQSPAVLVVLVVVMVLVGLNLLGAFEVAGFLQGFGSGATRHDGVRGAFATGALAVVVAAPCTAPFMGASLGFAATQPPAVALGVFAALATGFAAPFVILSQAPGLLVRLPRPGPWMVRLREVLAFPMFATAIWLVWVLAAQTGQAGVAGALIAALATGFALWAVRTTHGRPLWRAGLVALAVAVMAAGAWMAATAPSMSRSADVPEGAARTGMLAGEPWSEARIAALRAQRRTVFVNFTADWCVTCKVNEAVVFTRPEVAAAFDASGAAYLIADWTARDDAIAQALSSHGRTGVPLYLVYRPGEESAELLPQVLTPARVVKAVAKR